MRAGSLRHIVTFERQSSTKDAHGQPVNTWEAFAIRRAAVEVVSMSESHSSEAEHIKEKLKATVRYDNALAGLTPSDRLVFNGETFDIESVVNVGLLNRTLEITCRAE